MRKRELLEMIAALESRMADAEARIFALQRRGTDCPNVGPWFPSSVPYQPYYVSPVRDPLPGEGTEVICKTEAGK